MDGVAAKIEGLTSLSELDVLDSGHGGLIAGGVDHNVGSEKLITGLLNWVTSEDNVTRLKTNLSTHRHFDTVEFGCLTQVHKQEGLVEVERGSVNSSDDSAFVLNVVEVRTSDNENLTDFPVRLNFQSN
jgi:hypothetical protein